MSVTEYLEKQRHAQTVESAPKQEPSNDTPTKPAVSSQLSDNATEPGLLLRLWNRKMWAFPWAHFIEAEYSPPDSGKSPESDDTTPSKDFAEQIRMVFGAREIILHGRNLAVLMASIVRHRVMELREVPVKFLDADDHSEKMVVVCVEIRARGK